MYVKNYILRKIQGDAIPLLTVEQIQPILSTNTDNDRIYRAILNSQNQNQQKDNQPQRFHEKTETEFAGLMIQQLEWSLVLIFIIKPSMEILTYNEKNSILNPDLSQYSSQLPQEEILKSILQTAYRSYKAADRVNKQGLEAINQYENQLSEILSVVNQEYGKKCIYYVPQFGNGCDFIEIIQQKTSSLFEQVHQLRNQIQDGRKNHLQKQITIIEKSKAIQRIKFTLEKINILKSTFGQLAKRITLVDDDAYQLIPIMKETQNNINKYKLHELNLQCINNNFFENKIELLKERIKEGIYLNFLKFDSQKYNSLLQSYFYIEKHYQMQPYITQVWNLAKKSIKVTFQLGIEDYEKQFERCSYKNAQDEYLLIFYKNLFGEIIEQLLNFHLCNRFHQNNEFAIDDQDQQFEFSEYAEQIRQVYLEIRQLIWQKIQTKLIKILMIHLSNILTLQLEHFILLLGYVCLLIKRAEDFSHSDTQVFLLKVKEISISYIKEMHQKNMRNTCTYLSNEQYQRLPLAKDQKLQQQFNIIGSLQKINKRIFTYLSVKREEVFSPDGKKHQDVSDMIANDLEMQQFYLFDYQNPFKLSAEDFQLITKAFWERKPQICSESIQQEMVLTQTSVRIIEWISNYAILAYYIDDLTEYIITVFRQLLDLYMYISYTQLVGQTQQKLLAETFQQVLKFDENREIEFYSIQYDNYSDALVMQERFCILKQFIDKFGNEISDLKEQEVFQIKDKKPLVDIVERAIASESLSFLAFLFKKIFGIAHIEVSNEQFNIIFTQYKEFLYRTFMSNFIRIDGIVQYIPQMKWEIRELHNEHNAVYLDRLIQFILDQRDKLKSLGGGVIPSEAQKDIFIYLAEHCLNIALESYGKVKKVNYQSSQITNTGREQMIYEFTIVCKAIEINTKQAKQASLNQEFIKRSLEYLKIFLAQNYTEIDQYISLNKTQIPHRLLLNLMYSCPSYNLLKKQQKRDLLTKFYKEYYDTFKLF